MMNHLSHHVQFLLHVDNVKRDFLENSTDLFTNKSFVHTPVNCQFFKPGTPDVIRTSLTNPSGEHNSFELFSQIDAYNGQTIVLLPSLQYCSGRQYRVILLCKTFDLIRCEGFDPTRQILNRKKNFFHFSMI